MSSKKRNYRTSVLFDIGIMLIGRKNPLQHCSEFVIDDEGALRRRGKMLVETHHLTTNAWAKKSRLAAKHDHRAGLVAAMRAGLILAAVLATACGARVPPERARGQIADVIDDFHAAASEADQARYLGHLADDGIFLGTDGTERWDKAAFRAFVEPYFSKGRGWTYRPRDRHIVISASGDLAWFDELLDHDRYGELRGTGVLRLQDDGWKIMQYNLTFTVPNEVSAGVVERIRAGAAPATDTAPKPTPEAASEQAPN